MCTLDWDGKYEGGDETRRDFKNPKNSSLLKEPVAKAT